MKNKNKIIITVTLVLAAYFIWSGLFSSRALNTVDVLSQNDQVEGFAEKKDSTQKKGSETEARDTNPSVEELSDREKVIQLIQEKFGATIHHRHTQVKALEKLISYLQKLYPDTWMDVLSTYLNDVFPEYAESMLELFGHMQNYNQWFQAERQNLMAMSPEARRNLIWEMRRGFFGDAVEEIWAEALKNEKVSDALIEINDQATTLNFTEQKEVYLDALNEVYGDELPEFLESRRQEVTDRFISLEQVQNNLRLMDVEQRRQSLSAMRRSLGMDEEAISRWQALDIKRDERRALGERYNKEKAVLKERYTGDEYQLALETLQNQLFQTEAEIIRNEEESGYFRFETPQVFGMN